MKHFMPAGKAIQEKETDSQKLQRLARASLYPHVTDAGKNSKQCGVCGVSLFTSPKIRQGLKVCDDCADEIPRLFCGRRSTHACFECHTTFPRIKLKMKDRKLYCKKCLKIKFKIDF
jgi:hypothetical protein